MINEEWAGENIEENGVLLCETLNQTPQHASLKREPASEVVFSLCRTKNRSRQ
jgi:hypothetical protein